ncbi:hypothetical protein L9F63_021440, partial [Diploptera punctata]
YNAYTYNHTTQTERQPDYIQSVNYEDGKWSKPYYDCGGGNIWMLTYTGPFFGFQNCHPSLRNSPSVKAFKETIVYAAV